MEQPHGEPVGSVAEEAIKLVQAFTSANHAGPDNSGSGAAGAAGDHMHSGTCQWCPLCRLVNTIRDNPDAVEAVVASASNLAHSMKSFLETASQSGPKDHS